MEMASIVSINLLNAVLRPIGKNGKCRAFFTQYAAREAVLPPLVTRKRANKAKGKAKGLPLDQATNEMKDETKDSKLEMDSILGRQVLSNLRRIPEALLLTKVGKFYESYFEQAPTISRLLGIKLSKKRWRTASGGHAIHPFCGFPITQLDRHLKTLVHENGHLVAVADEFLTEGGTFDRRLVRIVTPGTLVDESFIDRSVPNFLLAVYISQSDLLGLAWYDVSTGDFFTQHSTFENLENDVLKIAPREIVLAKRNLDTSFARQAISLFKSQNYRVSYTESEVSGKFSIDLLNYELQSENENFEVAEVERATSILNDFLAETLFESAPCLNQPHRVLPASVMRLDAAAMDTLEIRSTYSEGASRGSLFSAVKRTASPGGGRLLLHRLCYPSTVASEIRKRHALVATLVPNGPIIEDLVASLSSIGDAARVLQHIRLYRANPNDLSSVATFVAQTSYIKAKLAYYLESEYKNSTGEDQDRSALESLVSNIESCEDLGRLIDSALDRIESDIESIPDADSIEEGINAKDTEGSVGDPLEGEVTDATLSRKWMIKRSFSTDIDLAYEQKESLALAMNRLESDLGREYSAPSLQLKVTPKTGATVFVKKNHAKIFEARNIPSLRSSNLSRYYIVPEWSALNADIQSCELRLRSAETRAINELHESVSSRMSRLVRNCAILDELDVAISFARLARERQYIRPKILESSTDFYIENGRHPSVELSLILSARNFVSNSVRFEEKGIHSYLVTGPNMGGKSTFLRQTALLAILAQAGGYVPATQMHLGPVDAIFTRIGARDDIFRSQSTFFIEMSETANILKNATFRSLVLMDEVGRGTSAKDGLSISYGVMRYILEVNHSRTLFATHFHELAKSLESFKSLSFLCTDLRLLENGSFSFPYCVRTGINSESHGLIVARLAQVPSEAIEYARSWRQV